MARHHSKAAYRRRRLPRPTLLNTLMFRLSLLNPLTPKEFPMSNSRRNIIIRTVATIAGDIAVGVAMASACVWIIEAAALGLFLSFLLWLLTAILSLALSQYVIHPAVKVLLSDSKLDLAVDAVTVLGDRVAQFARSVLQPA
jgi:hypothetical protein